MCLPYLRAFDSLSPSDSLKELIEIVETKIAETKTKEMAVVTAKDYDSALAAQTACNLSGIVFSFADIMHRLCNTEKSTTPRNEHPICRLFAEQIMHLTSKTDYYKAYGLCEDEAKKTHSETSNVPKPQ
jgi:hypothetical protein